MEHGGKPTRSKKEAVKKSMINSNFGFISSLQYQVKSLTERVRAFEAGDKYVTMWSEFKKQLSAKDQENKKLKNELY